LQKKPPCQQTGKEVLVVPTVYHHSPNMFLEINNRFI
jgi:hypothetical protein